MGAWSVLKQLILGSTMVTLAAVPTALSAKARAPETLTRSGKWVVDYDRDACHLSALFGTGEDAVLMRLTRYEPGDWFDLTLYGDRVAGADARSEATADFGLGGAPVKVEAVNGKADKLPLLLFGSMRLDGWRRAEPDDAPPSLSPEQEAAVTGLAVTIERKKPFRLDFGSLARPMAQLRTCQSDLLKSWGYDPAVQTALARPVRPINPPRKWLLRTDYPSDAIILGQNGIVQFRLDVAADGTIAGCHVLSRTSPDVFADTTCRAVSRRAKLEPALDRDGRPVRSFYVQKVHWHVAN